METNYPLHSMGQLYIHSLFGLVLRWATRTDKPKAKCLFGRFFWPKNFRIKTSERNQASWLLYS